MTGSMGRGMCLLLLASVAGAQTRRPLTIDDLFSFTAIRSAKLAPDGKAAVLVTTRADWKRNRFRDDLWLWRDGSEDLIPLAQSGHDSEPEWSPDGKRVAFISDRPLELPADDAHDDQKPEDEEKEIARVWIINVAGGEAFPLYQERLKVHAFAWRQNSAAILFSVAEPLSTAEQEEKTRTWKDVSRWRGDDRGDLLLELGVAQIVPSPKPLPVEEQHASGEPPKPAQVPTAARLITRSRCSIGEIAVAPADTEAAFLTNSISGRLEHVEDYELYRIDLHADHEGVAKAWTHNEALERQLRWSLDGKKLYFGVFAASGNAEGKYKDLQGRLYALDAVSGQLERLGKEFTGSWTDYTVTSTGQLFALGQLGSETQLYDLTANAKKISHRAGTFEGLSGVYHAGALLFRHSASDQPTELFFARDASNLNTARQITHLNDNFRAFDLPQMKTFQWKSEDGTPVEGVLLYPPGRSDEKRLPMLTLVHGGPADADGNRFGADWYSWGMLAAAKGWLVFEPNYRGSTGYGDAFVAAISPHIVSVPGRDILAGVDALVKNGTADGDHLSIGGYSYGGYLTNWLITQTTRFRSAVTGAGAVEHASNWGNDDLTLDDAWYLGGLPWQNAAVYQKEAALFQFDKVTTPVHEVIGADDVRVSASQGYLLERALDALKIPHQFLIFPGEGHGLGKNPWHGYIKVREELNWLEKYDAVAVKESGKGKMKGPAALRLF